MMGEDQASDAELEFVKKAAVEVVRILNESRQAIMDEHSQSFRWLTGSLLAINGAAALGMFSNQSIANPDKVIPGALFVGGILTALLVGVASQRLNRAVVPALNEHLGYWLAVAHDGERVEARETELDRNLSAKTKLGIVGQGFGWLSAMLFLAGAIMIGASLQASPSGVFRDTELNAAARSVPSADQVN